MMGMLTEMLGPKFAADLGNTSAVRPTGLGDCRQKAPLLKLPSTKAPVFTSPVLW